VTSLNDPSQKSTALNFSKIKVLDATCSDSLLTAEEDLPPKNCSISLTPIPCIGSGSYVETVPRLTQSTVADIADSKSLVIDNSAQLVIKFELESSSVQCEETDYTNDYQVANDSDALNIHLSSDIDTMSTLLQREYHNRRIPISFKSNSLSSKIQVSPIIRRAFPRTNPAYVVTVKPGSGDKTYIYKQSVDSSVEKSGSSNSLNESSNIDSANITVEKYIVDSESADRKYSKFEERAVDCTLIDNNGNEVNIMATKLASVSLEGTLP